MRTAERCSRVTVADALSLIERVARPGFYGDLTIRVKNGGVTAVDVRQTYTEMPQAQ